MAMIKLLEYTFDNTIDENCLPTFTGVGETEVVDEVSGNVTKRIINVEETGLPTKINFSGKTALTELLYTNTSNVTNMQGMFQNCSSLTSLDLSNWNTSNVVDMSYIFKGCKSLTSLDLSNWNTSKVTNMSYMFHETNLPSIDLSNFNTENVTNMRELFGACPITEYINIDNFNTENVTSMNGMFSGCKKIKNINISHFNTSNVTDMLGMFNNCHTLETLDISNFNTENVNNMYRMFYNCYKLTSLDLSNFDMSNIKESTAMFYDCNRLTNIGLLYSPSSTINKITPLLPTSTSKNIYYLDAIPSELTPVSNVNFVEYKSNTISTNEVVLRSLPNGVSDTLDLMTGEYVQRVGEVVLDGSENWVVHNTLEDRIVFKTNSKVGGCKIVYSVSDKMRTMVESKYITEKYGYSFIRIGEDKATYGVFLHLENELFSIDSISKLQDWLSQNPITVQYELVTPITTTIDLKQHPYAYKDGYINLSSNGENSLTPSIEYSLPINRSGQVTINTQLVQKQQKQLDELESMIIANMVNTQYKQTLSNVEYMLGGE